MCAELINTCHQKYSICPGDNDPVLPYGGTFRRADRGLDLTEIRVDMLNDRLEIHDSLLVINEAPIKKLIVNNQNVKHRATLIT